MSATFNGTSQSLYQIALVNPSAYPFALRVWVYVASADYNQEATIFDLGPGNTNDRARLIWSNSSSIIAFQLYMSGGLALQMTATRPAADTWALIEITVDDGSQSLSVNGVQADSDTVDLAALSASTFLNDGGFHGFILGRNFNAATDWFKGKLAGFGTIAGKTWPLVSDAVSSPSGTTLTNEASVTFDGFDPDAPVESFTATTVGTIYADHGGSVVLAPSNLTLPTTTGDYTISGSTTFTGLVAGTGTDTGKITLSGVLSSSAGSKTISVTGTAATATFSITSAPTETISVKDPFRAVSLDVSGGTVEPCLVRFAHPSGLADGFTIKYSPDGTGGTFTAVDVYGRDDNATPIAAVPDTDLFAHITDTTETDDGRIQIAWTDSASGATGVVTCDNPIRVKNRGTVPTVTGGADVTFDGASLPTGSEQGEDGDLGFGCTVVIREPANNLRWIGVNPTLSVIAAHISGIDRVEWTINDGTPVDADAPLLHYWDGETPLTGATATRTRANGEFAVIVDKATLQQGLNVAWATAYPRGGGIPRTVAINFYYHATEPTPKYLSAVGNDSDDGGTTGTPWQTFLKTSDVATGANAGGEVYKLLTDMTLTGVRSSGFNNNAEPILYEPDGADGSVTISPDTDPNNINLRIDFKAFRGLTFHIETTGSDGLVVAGINHFTSCAIVGRGTDPEDPDVGDGAHWTDQPCRFLDCTITDIDTEYAVLNANIRNSTISGQRENSIMDSTCVVDVTITDQVDAGHADYFQAANDIANVVIHQLRAYGTAGSQSIFGDVKWDDLWISNVFTVDGSGTVGCQLGKGSLSTTFAHLLISNWTSNGFVVLASVDGYSDVEFNGLVCQRIDGPDSQADVSSIVAHRCLTIAGVNAKVTSTGVNWTMSDYTDHFTVNSTVWVPKSSCPVKQADTNVDAGGDTLGAIAFVGGIGSPAAYAFVDDSDTVPPEPEDDQDEITAAGDTLVIYFNEVLDSLAIDVTKVQLDYGDGNWVNVVDAEVEEDERLSVFCTVPTTFAPGQANPTLRVLAGSNIKDLAGNEVEPFTTEVTNNAADQTPPHATRAVREKNGSFTLYFDEGITLNGSETSLSFTIGGTTADNSLYVFSGHSLNMTPVDPIPLTDPDPTIIYETQDTTIEDAAGNAVGPFEIVAHKRRSGAAAMIGFGIGLGL